MAAAGAGGGCARQWRPFKAKKIPRLGIMALLLAEGEGHGVGLLVGLVAAAL
jgi:hypothetical protein